MTPDGANNLLVDAVSMANGNHSLATRQRSPCPFRQDDGFPGASAAHQARPLALQHRRIALVR
jgi:hypothetical protein